MTITTAQTPTKIAALKPLFDWCFDQAEAGSEFGHEFADAVRAEDNERIAGCLREANAERTRRAHLLMSDPEFQRAFAGRLYRTIRNEEQNIDDARFAELGAAAWERVNA